MNQSGNIPDSTAIFLISSSGNFFFAKSCFVEKDHKLPMMSHHIVDKVGGWGRVVIRVCVQDAQREMLRKD